MFCKYILLSYIKFIIILLEDKKGVPSLAFIIILLRNIDWHEKLLLFCSFIFMNVWIKESDVRMRVSQLCRNACMLYFIIFFYSFSKLNQCISNHLLGIVRTVGRGFISKTRSTGRDVKLSVDREQYERGVLPKTHYQALIYFTMVYNLLWPYRHLFWVHVIIICPNSSMHTLSLLN